MVRCADIDYKHGHVVRGHYFEALLTGHDRPTVPGHHLTLEEAMAAVESWGDTPP